MMLANEATPWYWKRLLPAFLATAVWAVLLVLFATVVSIACLTLLAKPAAAKVEVVGCTGTTVVLKDAEKRMLDLHNRERADAGLAELCVHPALEKAARSHSRDMIDRDYFSHKTLGTGESACERIRRFGYDWRACGENIAYGTGSAGYAPNIFDLWMNSEGHRANILSSNFREVGIGMVRGDFQGHPDTRMWTTDFGARNAESSPDETNAPVDAASTGGGNPFADQGIRWVPTMGTYQHAAAGGRASRCVFGDRDADQRPRANGGCGRAAWRVGMGVGRRAAGARSRSREPIQYAGVPYPEE